MSKKHNHRPGAPAPKAPETEQKTESAVVPETGEAEDIAEAAGEAAEAAEAVREAAPEAPKPAEAAAKKAGGAISFGGGANNAFIREFAETPRYKRTLEEIEEEEKLRAESGYPESRRPYRTGSGERRAASAFSEKDVPEKDDVFNADWSFSNDYTRPIDAGTLKASQRSAARGQRNSFVMPLSDMEDGELYAPEEPQPEDEETPPPYVPVFSNDRKGRKARKKYMKEQKQLAKQQKVTRFSRAFSQSRGFGVLMLITMLLNAGFAFGYMITHVARTSLFTSAETAMAAQNVTVYSVTFESPLTGLLKIVMYLLPVFDLIWTFKFRKTDKKAVGYNRKTVIVCLCLIALGLAVAIFDIAAAHLL